MRELPILFSAPMVRAILEGRKTVTRRVVKPQPAPWAHAVELAPYASAGTGGIAHSFGKEGHAIQRTLDDQRQHGLCKVPYQVGDRLWVREATEADDDMSDSVTLARFRADGASVLLHGCADPEFNGSVPHWLAKRRALPGIHMPKAWARIWIEVTEVRVERLQDISEAQAKAEGVSPANDPNEMHWQHHVPHGIAFRALWDTLAKPGRCWADNPWVWVVEFRRVEVAHG